MLHTNPMTRQIAEFIATTFLHWLRDPNAAHDLQDWTPRNIRDQALAMMPPPPDLDDIDRLRIANELARWMGEEDGYIQVRHQRDLTAMNAIIRVIDGAVEKKGAEKDADLVDDQTAMSYPRLVEWIGYVAADMKALLKEQKRLGRRPKVAFGVLLNHAQGSILDALCEV